MHEAFVSGQKASPACKDHDRCVYTTIHVICVVVNYRCSTSELAPDHSCVTYTVYGWLMQGLSALWMLDMAPHIHMQGLIYPFQVIRHKAASVFPSLLV